MKIIYETRTSDIGRFTPERLTDGNGALSVVAERAPDDMRVRQFHLLAAPVIGYEFDDDYEARLFDSAIKMLLESRAEQGATHLSPEAVAEAIRSAVGDLPIGTVLPLDDKAK